MPRPESVIVMVPALSSVVTAMAGATSDCWTAWPEDWVKRSFSHASAALEMSSRMKISLSVYREWMTISSSCWISA